MFTGKQLIAVRDEQRLLTYICFIEEDSLVLCTLKNSEIIKRAVLHSGYTQRASICLDKFSGIPLVLHCSDHENKRKGFLNAMELSSDCTAPDFPFIVLSQQPIGHFQKSNFEYGLISYKCRDSGKVYLRRFTQNSVDIERAIETPNCIGGLDFAIHGNNVISKPDGN